MNRTMLAVCAAFASVLPAGALAQDDDRVVVEEALPDAVDAALAASAPPSPGAAAAGGEAVISYTPDFFAPYNPATAEDMVGNVPGFAANYGGSARGFGQNAGNVLIDGERPSTTNQGVGDLLRRIPAGEVARIDLIRGQIAGVDMGGQTVVVNVIREVSAAASGTWRVGSMYNGVNGRVRANGEVTRSFRMMGANVTASLNIEGEPHAAFMREYVLSPAGNALQWSEQRYEGGPHGWNATASADRQIGAWTVRLNGRYGDGGYREDGVLVRIAGVQRPAGATAYPFNFLRNDVEISTADNANIGWEAGGDVERGLSGDLTLKLIGVQRRTEQTNRGTFSTYSAITGPIAAFDNVSENESGESVLRGFVTWTPREDVSVEIGAEGAFNYLESSNVVTGAGASVTRIEEKRAEPYVSGLWRARPGLTFDAAFQLEVSEISQSGFANRTRDFVYPKGSASVTWDVAANTQLRVTAEHRVGQLNFFDFQRSINLQQDTANAGNPDLVPQQTTELRAVLEQRFWGDGVVSATIQRAWFTDTMGQRPFASGGEGPGNLGGADWVRLDLRLDAPLDRIGVANSRLQANASVGDSAVVDPVTGLERPVPMVGCYFCHAAYKNFSIEFRKDYPAAGFSWGVDAFAFPGDQAYRLTEITRNHNNRAGFGAFVETTRFLGVTMRLGGGNFGNFYSDRYRYRFTGPRNASPLGAVEWGRKIEEYYVDLRVTGNF